MEIAFKPPGLYVIAPSRASVDPPAQLDRVLQDRFDALARETLLPNWDFENGLAIPEAAWLAAVELCRITAQAVSGAPVPVPAPCGDGTIHLRWSRGTTDVVIELKDHHAWWTRKGPGGRREGEFSDPRHAIALLRDTFA